LHQFLIRSAHRWGGAVAVAEEETSSTFEQIARRALSLAASFADRGLEKGDRVALLMPKSTEAIISLFGALLAGGIYVPVDLRWPADRIELALAECAPRFVVAMDLGDLARQIPSMARIGGIADSSITILDMKAGKSLPWVETLGRSETGFSIPEIAPGDPALILFTSGSSGRPKGVALSHKAVSAFVRWSSQEFKLGTEDRLASPSSLSFDLSTFDIFNMAWCGATCVIVPESIVWMPRFLAQFISLQRITAWYSVPSVLSALLAEKSFAQKSYPDLRLAVFAGEVLSGRDLARARTILPRADFYNLYGPTETNVVTWYRVPAGFDPDCPIPIGRACPYAELMFDPAGVEKEGRTETGDLLVAGDSLMLGYWNRPAETERAFVAIGEGNGKRFYRTGDRVARDPATGDFVFVGRKDRQVKRRGYRIELGEIENALRRHPQILDAAVISTRDGEMRTSIGAFACHDPHSGISAVEVRTHCARYLPAYMMPDQVVFLRVLPRNSRGKTDYAALESLLQDLS